MGVISITQRSERLGNLGGTSAAHGVTNTNIGQVNHTVARTFSPHYYSRNSHAGDDAITSGLGKIGDALTRIGVAVMQREEDRKVDDYANAMLDNMEKMGRDDREVDDWNTPDRKHLQGQKKGFYLRTGEGTKTVVDEWDRAFGDTFRKIGDSIDANDRVRERTMEKLASYRRSTMSRLADRQASEYRRMELDSAKGNLATQRMIWKNGRTEVLPDIFAQQERVDSLQLATPEKRKANREALAVQLAADFVDNSLQQCASAEDFDKVEEAVKGGLKDALPDLIADNLPGGEHTVDGEYRKALLDGVKKSRQSFEIQRDREERETMGEIANFSANALARGGLDDLEGALGALKARSAQLPKGSRLETVALQVARRLDKAADAEATRLTWEGIVDHAGDKETWTPPKGTRMAKHYKRLKDSFDRQAQAYMAEGALMADTAEKEMFKANEAQLRTALLGAGASSPGVVAGQLAQAAANGHITLDQYSRLRKEHEKVWSKEGMPDKAAAMVQILKDEFFSGGDYDPTATMGVNAKTGKFEYLKDPATNKPYPGQDAEWEVEELVKGEAPSGLMAAFAPGTAFATSRERSVWHKRTLTSDEQLRLLDWAMELAQHDGEKTFVHPRTGERLDKPFVLDAAAEFRKACREISTRKDAEEAQGRIVQLADALRDINAGAAKREALLADVVGRRDEARAKERSSLRQQKRRPFAPKMPGTARTAEAEVDEETED